LEPLAAPGPPFDGLPQAERLHLQGYTVAGGDASTGDASPPIPTACVPLRTRDGAAVFGLSCSAPAFPPAEDRLVAELGPRLVELAGRVRQGGPAL
jgi:DNA-binding IclR family transcriptional regulator